MVKIVMGLVVGFGLIFAYNPKENLRYFQTPTISLKDTSGTEKVLVNDSLNKVISSDGVPLYYFTQLNTGVCFDNKCRPLSIDIYWNVTGRYLGFEMPDEEFLSKTDHEPFTETEYLQLDSLLANPFLPLGNYAFYDLVDTSSVGDPEVDGVSGATSQDVKEYLVPGAAYTTYKLWNEIYGPFQDQVIASTENQINNELFIKILQSPVSADRIWAAERIDLLGNLNKHTADTIVTFIREGEYSESHIALKSITPKQLNSDDLQINLFELIGKVDYAIENQIFDKLKEATLSKDIIESSTSRLDSFTDMQFVNLLKLLKYHSIENHKLNQELQRIADSKNAYVKSQINNYLQSN